MGERVAGVPWRVAVVLAVMFSAFAVGPLDARASHTPVSYTFTGTVTDPLGRPVPGVAVGISGSDDAYTDAEGRYSFEYVYQYPTTEVTTFFVVEPQSRFVSTPTPGTYRVDFTDARYLLYSGRGPETISELPTAVDLSFSTTAPEDGLCASAADSRTGGAVPMTHSGGPTAGSPWSQWTGQLAVPETATAGPYEVTYFGVDCATGTRLTWDGYFSPPYNYNRTPYLVDLDAPAVSITLPATGRTHVQHKDVGASPDGQTRVIGTLSVGYHATDDAELESALITVTSADGHSITTTQRLSGRDRDTGCYFFGIGCFLVEPGSYTITVVVTDTVGRESAPATQTFVAVIG